MPVWYHRQSCISKVGRSRLFFSKSESQAEAVKFTELDKSPRGSMETRPAPELDEPQDDCAEDGEDDGALETTCVITLRIPCRDGNFSAAE